jgi:hypothetical protein
LNLPVTLAAGYHSVVSGVLSVEDTVAYLLKARNLEPVKQPLLVNGCETTFVSRHSLGKHVPAATDTHTTIEVLLETVSVQRSYKEDNWENRISSVRDSVRKRGSWKGVAVQRGLERVKLKNLYCCKPLQGNGW